MKISTPTPVLCSEDKPTVWKAPAAEEDAKRSAVTPVQPFNLSCTQAVAASVLSVVELGRQPT